MIKHRIHRQCFFKGHHSMVEQMLGRKDHSSVSSDTLSMQKVQDFSLWYHLLKILRWQAMGKTLAWDWRELLPTGEANTNLHGLTAWFHIRQLHMFFKVRTKICQKSAQWGTAPRDYFSMHFNHECSQKTNHNYEWNEKLSTKTGNFHRNATVGSK